MAPNAPAVACVASTVHGAWLVDCQQRKDRYNGSIYAVSMQLSSHDSSELVGLHCTNRDSRPGESGSGGRVGTYKT